MSTGLFPELDLDALYLSRSDVNELLGTFSRHGFFLDEREWPSVEHYYQAMKFESEEAREAVRAADHPKKARKLGRSRRRKLRGDWSEVKRVYMTRALYTKCKAWPEVARKLLATGERRLVENSQYDYYWGCGRDRRGDNNYGKVLMNVRAKLREEAEN
ncbi:NADAR family protein [Mangrovimicrobium sediminis]|uniref:NADAR family protein n=1 Tax=Mangrovimicrobium sediminis TaxID=2562682 RepID=A0A4Z0M1U4_9GAMM|nr:NADAR family protein [Haliea sp. SAOS-164]TGD73407.1 NADAR family protein [Haliea sp. SAOS-164]